MPRAPLLSQGPLGRLVRVVAFTGMPGSGKSEAVAVARDRGAPVVVMGDLVREEVARRGVGPEDPSVGRVATDVRQADGMDAWAARTVERIVADHADEELVVVDGVRNWEEVDRFREELGDDFHLVAITSSPEERLDRLTRRGREDDPADESEARARDEREMGWGIARAIAMADSTLTNAGSLAEFKERVGRFLDDVVSASP